MKTMLSLFFLFLTFTAKPLVGAVDAEPDPVLDTNGDQLRTGATYYIQSVSPEDVGLTLPEPNANGTCPIGIIGRIHEHLPVTFSPVNTTDSVIRVSTDLIVQFNDYPPCDPPVSHVWNVSDEQPSGQWFVTIGGNPGPQTYSTWFKIEKSECESYYKLVHCPSVCRNETLCSGTGFYDEDGVLHLALSYQPNLFMFDKVHAKSATKRNFSVI